MKPFLLSVAVIAGVLLAAQDARAQVFTLTVSPSTFAFETRDNPSDGMPCAAPPLTIGYKAAGLGSKKNPANNWHISVRAQDDMREVSGGVIPVANISWTAGTPFNSGAQLLTTDQTLFDGTGNMAAINYTTLTFSLKNSWTYKFGDYSTTIIFTISQP